MYDEDTPAVAGGDPDSRSREAGPASGLTPYELGQIRDIAAWKSVRPSHISEIIDTITAPVTWAVGHVVPRSIVTRLVTSMESIASKADIRNEVAVVAGVADIDDLSGQPLEVCDRLARRFSARAERFAMIESAAASLGGPLFHVPQQLIAALRSIARIGHCYGYRLDKPIDHAVVIDILEIAMLQDPRERQTVIESLHSAIDGHAESLADELDILAKTSRTMIAEEVLDFVPVVGTAVSFLFDNQFMHSVDETARRVFQERWLRDRGRVAWVPPAPLPTRKSSLQEFGLAIGQGMYCVGAVVGFGASFPCRFIQHAVGRPGSPIGSGARDGTDHAVGDAREFLAGLKYSYEVPEEAEALAQTAPIVSFQ